MALDIANTIEQLSNATIIEIADLVKQLESKWGVTAAAPVAVAAAGGAAGGAAAPAAEAKTAFDVILDDGSHMTSHMVDTFRYLFPNGLASGGVYIVEDIGTNYQKPWRDSPMTFVEFTKST